MNTERKEYLTELAERYGLELRDIIVVAHLLGEEEDHDGLIVMIEDCILSKPQLGE